MKYIITILITLFALAANAKEKERIHAILLSGNGTSFETAYKVHNIPEEYTTLTHLNKKPNMQMFIIYKNEAYDVFRNSKTGEKIFFKIIKPAIVIYMETRRICF